MAQPVREYYFPGSYNGKTYELEMGLLAGTCLLFNVDVVTKNNGVPQNLFMTETFLNAIPYNPPFVFDLPPQCANAKVGEAEGRIGEKARKVMEGLNFHHALLNKHN